MSRTRKVPLTVEQVETLRERFKTYCVRTKSGCLEWTGAVTSTGTGVMRVGSKKGAAAVHRIAWTLAGKELPAPLTEVVQICGNKLCVKVSHLRVRKPSLRRIPKKPLIIQAGVSLAQAVKIIGAAVHAYTARDLQLPPSIVSRLRHKLPESPSLALFLRALRAMGLEVKIHKLVSPNEGVSDVQH